MTTVDVLMITFNAPAYVKLSLERVFESCDDNTRIWLWHNGMHEEMLDVVTDYARDPRVHRFHHSVENVRLTEPTNWLWSQSDGEFVSKVDDDCLLPVDWITKIKQAHVAAPNANLGAVAASRLRPEDIEFELLRKKIACYENGVNLFRNHWVQGSGYLMPRKWVDRGGLLQDGESWTNHCLALAHLGAVNGFLYPLLFEDHMDDPRSDHSLMKTDADLEWRMPLSITRNKITDLESWEGRMRRSAHGVQTASLDLRVYRGWRRKLNNQRDKVRKFLRP